MREFEENRHKGPAQLGSKLHGVATSKGKESNKKCMVPTVKHGGGSVHVWHCRSRGVAFHR